MIESIENAIQLAALICCAAVALYRAIRERRKAWLLLAFFCGSYALGDIYWQTWLILFGQTPGVPIVSDLSWYAANLFLFLLAREAAFPEGGVPSRRLLPWIGPAFTAAMAVFYMRWGMVVSNVIYAALMGLLLYEAIDGLLSLKGGGRAGRRWLCVALLAYCLLVYGAWTASCFWFEDGLRNPYLWFDFMQTLCFILFLPATKRAVAA